MKKKCLLFFLLGLALILNACAVDKYFENRIKTESGILEDAGYQAYQSYEENGKLDSAGFYAEPAEEAAEAHAPIHVTFAENSNLQIQYYLDAGHQAVVGQPCYLNPGDSIYAAVSVKSDVFSSVYAFSAFRITGITEDGRSDETASMQIKGEGQEYVLTIPPDYEGTELSVEAVGAYENRVLSLRDYCVDDNGTEMELNGTWLINEKEYQGDTAEISPISPYIISYKYDSDEFFYVSSEPECYYSNPAEGVVIFPLKEPTDSTQDYAVELHKYLETSLVSDVDRKVIVLGKEETSVKANAELKISQLQYGQTVVLVTDQAWPALESRRDLIVTSGPLEREWNSSQLQDYILKGYGLSGSLLEDEVVKNYISDRLETKLQWEPGEDGTYNLFEYTMVVPEKEASFLFDPADYSYEHGTVSFRCFGQPVTSPQALSKGSRIYYEEKTAEDGYWLVPGDNNFVIVGEETVTKRQLQAIHFTPKVEVAVTLAQPAYGGSVTYKVEGRKIYTSSYSAYSGTVIEMSFAPWEGWVLRDEAHDGDTYTVIDAGQAAGEEYSIDNSLFKEAEDHKPEFTVTLEKNVGAEMGFSVSASGLQTDISKSGKNWVAGEIKAKSGKLDFGKIGTEIPIKISMQHRSLQNGKAMRFVITKTPKDKNGKAGKAEKAETRYVTNMTAEPDPFYIYKKDEDLFTATTYYHSIDIKINVVDIETFSRPAAAEHTEISIINMQTGEAMHDGELIEGSGQVTVRISPKAGYYLTGKNVHKEDGVYQESMKYSEYAKKASGIIANHPAKKYCKITLDTSDAFASYAYKLDGKAVSGSISAKEGQKLSLTYEITDGIHTLCEGAGGVPLIGLGKSYKKVTEDLKITSEMDGKTITKDDFGIAVKGE